MAFKEAFLKDRQLKSKILKVVKSGKLDFKRELKAFLPITQHMVIKGFPETLIAEIERNVAYKWLIDKNEWMRFRDTMI